MVETLSYTRENISNRSHIVSNIEDVPVNRQNTAKLNICGAIGLRTLKQHKTSKNHLKARRRQKNSMFFSLRAYPIPLPGEGGVSKFKPVKALIRVFNTVKVLWWD